MKQFRPHKFILHKNIAKLFSPLAFIFKGIAKLICSILKGLKKVDWEMIFTIIFGASFCVYYVLKVSKNAKT